MNLGLRYEVFMSPKKVNRSFGGIILGPGATRQEQVADGEGRRDADELYDTDWNNFGPRLGVAWDRRRRRQARSSARGGGLSYNRINNTVWSDERLNPPFFAQRLRDGAGQRADRLHARTELSAEPRARPRPRRQRRHRGARIDLRVIDPETTLPYSYNWFAGVQRQMPWDLVVEAELHRQRRRNLMSADGPGGEDYNRFAGDLLDGVPQPPQPELRRGRPRREPDRRNYHGLTLQVNRRFNGAGSASRRPTRWARPRTTPASAEEVTDLARDYGNAGFDVRHKLALNVIWQIPYEPANAWLRNILGGWQLNTITIWQSGQPFTVTCGSPYPTCDFNADGNNGDRVNLPSLRHRPRRHLRRRVAGRRH